MAEKKKIDVFQLSYEELLELNEKLKDVECIGQPCKKCIMDKHNYSDVFGKWACGKIKDSIEAIVTYLEKATKQSEPVAETKGSCEQCKMIDRKFKES